jgi:hypothetical protein
MKVAGTGLLAMPYFRRHRFNYNEQQKQSRVFPSSGLAQSGKVL